MINLESVKKYEKILGQVLSDIVTENKQQIPYQEYFQMIMDVGAPLVNLEVGLLF